jgi:putative PIN family toxin of toxin-antitoxin system
VRTVLDTSVLVAALRSDTGASRRLVEIAFDGRFALLLSVPLMIEYEATLTRREHLAASELSAPEVGVILDALAAVGEPVRLSFRWRPMLTDPADDMVLETAVNGRAELLVTFNRRHFAKAARLFRLTIASPGEALKQLETNHATE